MLPWIGTPSTIFTNGMTGGGPPGTFLSSLEMSAVSRTAATAPVTAEMALVAGGTI